MLWLLRLCVVVALSVFSLHASQQNWLEQDPYPDSSYRADRLENDLDEMWRVERVAGRASSTIDGRKAARRVFAHLNLNFKGTQEEWIKKVSRMPDKQSENSMIYLIETPTYTDEYTVNFEQGEFKSVTHRRVPLLFRKR